ncbi:hypothetical protein NLU13_3179 [Sarocladium strictum]|uniref:RNA helicase n=1 Tax=Sarocladium strictum TaxID=5046 RepID=A0AA39GNB4_SARSR|nr:hypothetical protein NLU13_3179 [Sarocladium strictum]
MPLDIEEIIRKKRAEQAERSKLKFIPRRIREQQAAEEAKKKEAEEKKKPEEHTRRHEEAKKKKAEEQSAQDDPVNAEWRAIRECRNASSNGRKRTAQEIENENLYTRYMGPEVNKHSKFSAEKKRQRSAANKFNFSWDPSEDTTRGESSTPIIKPPESSLSSFSVENPFDLELETRRLTEAHNIRKAGHERAEERADEIMASFYRAREKYEQKLKGRSSGRRWNEKDLAEMTPRDWRILKEDFAISTKGGVLPNPMRNWQESGLSRSLLDIVDKVGYSEPTAIQRAAIPIALSNRDLIGVAYTGSGKTAAFLLPLLDYISTLPILTESNKDNGPYALILAPTRELAQQIEAETIKFARPLGFNCVSIVGGHSINEQMNALNNGAEIIVATPGRLVDCLEQHLLVLEQCCYLVMDEADRMIDLGFEESVNKILRALPSANEKPDNDDAEDALKMRIPPTRSIPYRQTMMYTATMPPSVEKIAKMYLRRPATVTIGTGEAVTTVEQRVEFIQNEEQRKARLKEILSSDEFSTPIIVFVNTKRNCDVVARELQRFGWDAVVLHGSKTQEQREASLQSVRDGRTQILVATDLAGRGIDVPDISLVVNYNMASSIESYTHRIGRTGRAGKQGVAITFLGDEDNALLHPLKQIIRNSSISKVSEELKVRASKSKF